MTQFRKFDNILARSPENMCGTQALLVERFWINLKEGGGDKPGKYSNA